MLRKTALFILLPLCLALCGNAIGAVSGGLTLEHSWLVNGDQSKGKIANLMDYGYGSTLTKYQWDMAHNPQLVIGMLESDEDAMRKRNYCNDNEPLWKGTIDGEITFSFGKRFVADGYFTKQCESCKSCYKTYYWNKKLQKWLVYPLLSQHTGKIRYNVIEQNGQFWEVAGSDFEIYDHKLNENKEYSLKPLSSKFENKNDLYKFALLFSYNPNIDLEDYYLDIYFLEVLENVYFYFSELPSPGPGALSYSEGIQKGTLEVYKIIAESLMSNDKDSLNLAIKTLENRNKWFNNFAWTSIIEFYQPTKSFRDFLKIIISERISLNSTKLTDDVAKVVTDAGEMLGNFGIPKYYTYTSGGKSIFIHPHAMKHLEELGANGAKLGNDYLKLLGQTHQKSLHSAIDDVLSRGAIEFRKMYYSGGNEIMFGAPKDAGLLPAVIHFR